jgi:solute carrier family 25, member 39/40
MSDTVGKYDTAKKRCNKSGVVARLVSGSVGSIVTSLVVTPLEVVKVRMQAYRTEIKPPLVASNIVPCPRGCGVFVLDNGQIQCMLSRSMASFFDSSGRLTAKARTAAAEADAAHVGIMGMLRRIFAEEGYAGIYAGLRPSLVMAVPNTVIYFSVYDEVFWQLKNKTSNPQANWIPMVAGGSARILASSFTAPFELLRTQQALMVANNEVPLTMAQEFRLITQTEGIPALYRGLTSTLWRDVPFSAIYWLCLERFRIIWRLNATRAPSPLEQAGQAFVNGATAGMIAAACTTPFDNVKTLQQTSTIVVESVSQANCHHDGLLVAQKPAGLLYQMRSIVANEGVGGLWRGNVARMVKVAPSCAIMISCYEFGKRVLE